MERNNIENTNVAIITEEGYDNAVHATINELAHMPGKDGEKGGMGAMLATISGAMFAAMLKDKLFVKEDK